MEEKELLSLPTPNALAALLALSGSPIKDGGESFRTVPETGFYSFEDLSLDAPSEAPEGSFHTKGFDVYREITTDIDQPAIALVIVHDPIDEGYERAVQAYIFQRGNIMYFSGAGNLSEQPDIWDYRLFFNNFHINGEDRIGDSFVPVGY